MDKSPIAERFAANLAVAIERAGNPSQEAIANRAEMHRTQVSELLRGKQLPRLDTLVKLAGALNVQPAELIEGITFEPAEQRGQFKVKPAKKH